jgi:hypothetical protein
MTSGRAMAAGALSRRKSLFYDQFLDDSPCLYSIEQFPQIFTTIRGSKKASELAPRRPNI